MVAFAAIDGKHLNNSKLAGILAGALLTAVVPYSPTIDPEVGALPCIGWQPRQWLAVGLPTFYNVLSVLAKSASISVAGRRSAR